MRRTRSLAVLILLALASGGLPYAHSVPVARQKGSHEANANSVVRTSGHGGGDRRRLAVAVLVSPGLSPVGTPSGMTPEWITGCLNSRKIKSRTVVANELEGDWRAVVNPYGQAFPAAASEKLLALQASGVPLINLAGVPFLAPDGTPDPTSPARFGVFAPSTWDAFFTHSEPTELGRALLPSMPSSLSFSRGAAVHGPDPDLERPLARFSDDEGIDGGPSIVLSRGARPFLAVGYVGEDHPLNPALAHAGAVLAELVDAATSDAPVLTAVEVQRDGERLIVEAKATGGRIAGTGVSPAPARWSPEKPEPHWVVVRLYQGRSLVDARSVPSNMPDIRVDGDRVLVNGRPFVVKGMTPGHSFPPGTDEQGMVAWLKRDLEDMRAAGVNAIRGYGLWSDWWLDYTARKGIFFMEAVPLGWTYDLTDAQVDAVAPWASFMAARGRERHAVLVYSLGNEILDPRADSVLAKLRRLADLVRAADTTHPVTYAAHETSLLTLGPMDFLDIYSWNNYGLTWPLSVDASGFAAQVAFAKAYLANGRPTLITEFGVNGWPGGAAAQVVSAQGAPAGADQLELAQAQKFYEKWAILRDLGVSGGYAFIWVDPLNHDLPVPGYLQIVGGAEYPPGSGYHPLNEEEFWGFNDVNRRRRKVYDALVHAFTGRGWAPTVELPVRADPAPAPVPGSPLLRTEAGKLLDGDGREVILRGIAVIKKSPPYIPAVGPEDFARIRSWGMNSIRLGTSWQAIEPEKGVYDQKYLDALAALAEEATKAGLYVVVDMHQDVFGRPYGNGAPEWATISQCPHTNWAAATGVWAANYLSPAVMCAFTNFWTSPELQSHYAGAWREVARKLAHNPRIAGYDLMNEPSQGFIPPGVFETQFLYPAQARWLAEIGTVDPHHCGFLGAPNYKNVHLPTFPMLAPPANTAYAPHLYGFWDGVPGQGAELRTTLADANFEHSVREARLMGLPMWLGEFGMVHNAPGAGEFVRHVYDLTDEARAGAAYWEYTPGDGYSPVDRDGSPRPILSEVARSYPAAVPGLNSFTFDAATSVLAAAWSGSGEAVFAVPVSRYLDGILVDTDGSWTWNPAVGEVRIVGGSRLVVSRSRTSGD